MIVGLGEAMSSLQGGDEGLQVLTDVLQRVRDGGDFEEEDDGYYSSSDEEGPVTAEMAARGVGEAGCVVVADSIWNRLVPHDFLRVYDRARRDREEETSPPTKRGPVDSMLQSLRVDTGGLLLTSAPPTARMFLTYKNKLKCRAILDARKVSASDPRKPPKFRLPALEGIRRWMGDAQRNRGGGSSVPGQAGSAEGVLEYQAPPRWRRVFVVQGGSGRKFRYARLPFGWSYSLAICQRLVMAVVRRVLSRRGIRGWVYLDDILLSARRKRRLRRAVRECQRLLQRAGFIVGAKSETVPTESIGFIGKQLDTREGTISNAVGAFRAWVRGLGRGRLPSTAMERLLGKLCWLGKPNAGLGAFLANAYSSLHRDSGCLGGVWPKVLQLSCSSLASLNRLTLWDSVTHPLGRFLLM